LRATTFYSYKGGLGRTLLVAWAARRLARDGQSVVAIDLDLEAPGLHYKLGLDAKTELGPGLVDLIGRFQRGEAPPTSIRDLLIPVPGARQVWLLPAGPRDSRTYLRALAAVSWEGLFRGESPQGPRFFTWLKESISKDPSPDHLLIDARTGITEMGGAALAVMADQILALVGTSPEGLDGTRSVLQSVAEFSNAVHRPVPRLGLVLSRIPWLHREEEIQQLRERVRDRVEQVPSELHSSLIVGLPLVVRSEPDLQIDEALVLGSTDVEVCSDYDLIRNWLNGAEPPQAPPSALFPSGASSGTLRAIVNLERERTIGSAEQRLSALAQSLEKLSASESASWHRESAVAAIEESVAIWRQLAKMRPEVHEPALVTSLNNYSLRLSLVGLRERALAASEEATARHRELARLRGGRFAWTLPDSLGVLAVHLQSLKKDDEALRVLEEAVAVLREWDGSLPGVPDLSARSLATHLIDLSDLLDQRGRTADALIAVDEAAGLLRDLERAGIGGVSDELARSLHDRSRYLMAAGRPGDALIPVQEATALRRQLAQARPDFFTEYLALSLIVQSDCLAALHRNSDAYEASREALTLVHDALRDSPFAWRATAKEALQAYLDRCEESAREPDAALVKPISDILGDKAEDPLR
jgi:MinD-like ATPase involved in chromosome partitioning or flagellar assembly